jgi:hypothetical protein
MDKKITKAQRNADIIAILRNETPTYGTTIAEAISHLEHENELLAKRASRERKTNPADETYMELLYDAIGTDPVLLCDVSRTIPEFVSAGLPSQKVTSLAGKLCDQGRLIRVVIKGRGHFQRA